MLPPKPLQPKAPASDMSSQALSIIIKIIACNAYTSASPSAWMSNARTQVEIQGSASTILLGCLSSRDSVARVCSLFLGTIATFMLEPPKHVPGSSSAPKVVWGLSLSRTSLCPSASRAGVVLSVLLDTMQDLSRFDRYVAQYAAPTPCPPRASALQVPSALQMLMTTRIIIATARSAFQALQSVCYASGSSMPLPPHTMDSGQQMDQ